MSAQRWPSKLAEPFNPLDCTLIARAQSITFGVERQSIGGKEITADQARDVIRWAEGARSESNRRWWR